MKRNVLLPIAVLLAVGCLRAGEPTPEQIKRQNQYVEYRMAQGEIYRICVKMNDGVTTVQFPSAITEIAGKNVSTEGKNTDFIIQAQPGSYYFNVAATAPNVTGTLTVTHNRKLYILYLIQSEKEAYASVVFRGDSGKRNGLGALVSETPKISPARLVSLIDIAKKYPVLAENHPEAVAGCERADFQNRYRCGKYDILLMDVTRFEDEDTVIFHVVLDNLTPEEIAYDKHSFSAHAGNQIYYMSVSDASGIMPPRSRTHAWFGITSTSKGGRNNLKADNDWLLALTTREMHVDRLQSVRNEVEINRKRQEDERRKLLAEEKKARRQISSAKKLMTDLTRQQEAIRAEKADLEREKQKIREAREALKTTQAIQALDARTQAVLQTMRTQTSEAIEKMRRTAPTSPAQPESDRKDR